MGDSMSSMVLSGDTSGTVTVTVPAVAGTNTITLPAGTGTAAVQGVSTNIVSGTAVASTSGTSIDFTSIPSWVKRITVMFQGVSLSGSALPLIQIGAGSVTTSGYVGCGGNSSSGTGALFNSAQYTTGFGIGQGANASVAISGIATINLLGSNSWIASGTLASTTEAVVRFTAGSITLGGTLDRVRITTSNGTDTFDAGSINILYE